MIKPANKLVTLARAESESTTVFISYPHEDAPIAAKLQECIRAMIGNRFDVFLDFTHISGGQQIEPKIETALERTVYFIALGTDVQRTNFNWCGLELGYYRALNKARETHITCIYHDRVPDLFHNYRCFKILPVDRGHIDTLDGPISPAATAPLHQLLVDIAQKHNRIFPAQDEADFFRKVDDWANEWTRELTDIYVSVLKTRVKERWFPQARLQISIPDGDFWRDDPVDLPNEAQVEAQPALFLVFGTAVPSEPLRLSRSWAEFKALIEQQTGASTIPRMMRDIILSVLPSNAEARNDFICQAKNGRYYRIILVMHQRYGDGKREFVLNLIETLERNYGGDPFTTRLTAAIMLAARYRSIFLEQDARYGPEKFLNLADDELSSQISQLLIDLDRINADAAADGLADQNSLSELLGNGPQVKSLFAKWWPPFIEMENAAKNFLDKSDTSTRDIFLMSHRRFLEVSSDVNRKFTSLSLKAYLARVDGTQ